MYSARQPQSGHAPGPSYSDLHDYYDEPAHRLSTYSVTPGASNYDPAFSRSSLGAYSQVPDGHYVAEARAQHEDWREKANALPSRKRRWALFIFVGAVALIATVGIIAGVVSTQHKSNKRPKINIGDPSSFSKDPALKQVFSGMSYTPAGSQLPGCGNTLEDVILDMQLLSQLTTRIRLYGADCNQSALVLEAIKQTKVDMKVYLGNYVIATDNGAAYRRQRDTLKDAITQYGVDNIEGITVGNEFMLNYLNANGGGADPNTAVGDTGAQILISNIQDTRSMLSSMNLPKTIPVGTSDAGSFFNTKVLGAVDYGMANVHPYFANVSIANAAQWTFDFFQNNNVGPANALANHPKMYIAETGWPTKSSDAGNANNGASDASEPNLQTFLDNFVCPANKNGVEYFYFEMFDEKWKDLQFGGVEGWWGLMSEDRKLKSITIPSC